MSTDLQEIRRLQQKTLAVTQAQFDELALEVFQFQAQYNSIYKQYLELLQINPRKVQSITQIPFLPISLFKTQQIKSGDWEAAAIFTSSGTTGQVRSQHQVESLDYYQAIAVRGFEEFYGKVEDFCFLALLPSYLERSGSSLVAMVDDFIQRSQYKQSGFFLYDWDSLIEKLTYCKIHSIPCVLLGVSFALLDLAEQFQLDLSHCIIMETGGMKDRRAEILRSELHAILANAFQVEQIHSEYGMTELLSQAYSKGNGIFYPSATLKVLIRDTSDPFAFLPPNRNGSISIIDLANVHSCAFIATDDLGKTFEDGSFIVHGRRDQSDLRGCNLMLYELGIGN